MPDKMYKVNQQKRLQLSFMYGGLIGIGILFIIDLVNQTPLDGTLTIALFCFSIALPFLGLLIVCNYLEATHEYTIQSAHMRLANWLGILGIFAGLLAEIWHISWIAGGIFLLCSLWSVIGYSLFQTALKKAHPREDAAEPGQSS
jgi:hypothetical protein